ncbi:MAG TPA: Clp protease N-terminal domain-containing protein [Acidimicrobiales bacterium]|jgi:hypothetical protein|nr:Clp protease N-terminal domain-containing protein [Acidimicrobiales bacterium]
MDLDDLKREADRHASSDAPLDRLAAAVAVAQRVSELGDELIDDYVEAARAANCSWAQVGEVLGVTRQAAQQRQKSLMARMGRRIGSTGLFKRFTVTARTTVVGAQESARMLGHQQIGTEHVLMSLARREDGVAAEVFRRAGVTPDDVEAAVMSRSEPGGTPSKGHIRFTGEAKEALTLALRESLGLRHTYIGTEHILLALTATPPASETLAELGLDHERVKAEVTAILAESGPERGG